MKKTELQICAEARDDFHGCYKIPLAISDAEILQLLRDEKFKTPNDFLVRLSEAHTNYLIRADQAMPTEDDRKGSVEKATVERLVPRQISAPTFTLQSNPYDFTKDEAALRAEVGIEVDQTSEIEQHLMSTLDTTPNWFKAFCFMYCVACEGPILEINEDHLARAKFAMQANNMGEGDIKAFFMLIDYLKTSNEDGEEVTD